MICELCLKRKATQADNYQNLALCDNCYSKLGRLSDDYQGDINKANNYVESLSFKNLFGEI